MNRTTRIAVALATTISAFSVPAAASWAESPQVAAKPSTSKPSRLYPNLGNKGYTVDSYDLFMRYQPQNGKAPVKATTVIKAKTTERLKSFTLDAADLDVT
ncbi:hypothetical protein ACIGW8_39470, partial [Streptomyces sioyaensis]